MASEKKNIFCSLFLDPASQPRCSPETRGPAFWSKRNGATGANTLTRICLLRPPKPIWRPFHAATSPRAVRPPAPRLTLVDSRFYAASCEDTAVLAAAVCWAPAAHVLEPQPCSSAKYLSTRCSHAAKTQLCQHLCDRKTVLLLPPHMWDVSPGGEVIGGQIHTLGMGCGAGPGGGLGSLSTPPERGENDLLSGLCAVSIQVFLRSAIRSL